MPSEPPIKNDVLKHCLEQNKHLANKIWQGKSANRGKPRKNQISTGYQNLDNEMGGWQLGATTEIGLIRDGIGEFRLLIPAIKELQSRATGTKHIVCINPPLLPYAPALKKFGINLQLLTLIQPKNIAETLWSCEQVLLSGTAAATLCWTDSARLNNTQLRRMQLAVEKHNGMHLLFRNQRCLEQASVSRVRLSLNIDNYSRLKVDIKKQVCGWGNRSCTVSLIPHYEKWQKQTIELWPVPKWQKSTKVQPQLELISELKTDNLFMISTQKILVAVCS